MSLAAYRKLLGKYSVFADRSLTNKTHVSMIEPKGLFSIESDGIHDLWKTYCEMVRNGETANIGLAEMPQDYLPILVDADIKVKEREFGHLIEKQQYIYTDEQLKKVVKIYQNAIREVIDKIRYKNLICIVLQKKPYRITLANGEIMIKSGFHLHFPYTIMENKVHTTHIIPRAKKMIDDEKLFLNINLTADDIIDTGYCKAPWLMYGARKSIGADTYKVTKAISGRGDEMSIYDALKNITLYDENRNVIDISQDVDYYLPMLLSIKSFGRESCEPKSSLKSILDEEDESLKKKLDKITDEDERDINLDERKLSPLEEKTVEQNIECASELMPMIADYRASDRNEWMTIGWVLFNCSRGDDRAMRLWIDFSSRDHEKFDEQTCINIWEKMIPGELTIGTLYYYASVDSPEAYQEYKKEKSKNLIKESLNGSHYDIAYILYTEYKSEFACASVSTKMWFQYKNHHWSEIEDGIFLRQKISGEIVGKYAELGANMFKKLSTLGNDKAKEFAINASIKQVNKIISNLKSAPYKANVMKEAADLFYNEQFKEKLDQNPMMIAFKNGVYELDINIFRPGMPEDYISKTLPIEYKQYNMEDQDVLDLLDFLEKIFPDNSIRKYFLDNYCDIFVGGNLKKKIHVWTGAGDNGKSVFQLLFDIMLGQLSIKFEPSVFSGKKSGAGVAAPELARAAPPVRKITVEEPDGDESFNIGHLKKLSGGDRYWARDLFEKGKATREINPMFIIDIVCNENLPDLKHADQAIFNRVRVIPFESVFVRKGEYCPETKEEQLLLKRFPRDEQFSAKLKKLAPVFAWYLIEWRKNIVNGDYEPEKVLEATKLYHDSNNVFKKYITECIIEDPKSTVNMVELWVSFKEWYKEEYSNSSHPNKSKVKDNFVKIWGKCLTGNIWKGYRIKTLQDEINEGNAIVLGEEDMAEYGDDGNGEEVIELSDKKRRILQKSSGMPPI